MTALAWVAGVGCYLTLGVLLVRRVFRNDPTMWSDAVVIVAAMVLVWPIVALISLVYAVLVLLAWLAAPR